MSRVGDVDCWDAVGVGTSAPDPGMDSRSASAVMDVVECCRLGVASGVMSNCLETDSVDVSVGITIRGSSVINTGDGTSAARACNIRFVFNSADRTSEVLSGTLSRVGAGDCWGADNAMPTAPAAGMGNPTESDAMDVLASRGPGVSCAVTAVHCTSSTGASTMGSRSVGSC